MKTVEGLLSPNEILIPNLFLGFTRFLELWVLWILIRINEISLASLGHMEMLSVLPVILDNTSSLSRSCLWISGHLLQHLKIIFPRYYIKLMLNFVMFAGRMLCFTIPLASVISFNVTCDLVIIYVSASGCNQFSHANT